MKQMSGFETNLILFYFISSDKFIYSKLGYGGIWTANLYGVGGDWTAICATAISRQILIFLSF